jgi:hypothetical protein
MNDFATPDFWYHYRQLPREVRELADKNFALLRQNLHHSSLRLKKAEEDRFLLGGSRGIALSGARARSARRPGLVLDWAPQRIRTVDQAVGRH